MNEIKKQGQEDTVGGGGDRDGAALWISAKERAERQAGIALKVSKGVLF